MIKFLLSPLLLARLLKELINKAKVNFVSWTYLYTRVIKKHIFFIYLMFFQTLKKRLLQEIGELSLKSLLITSFTHFY